MKKFRVLIVFMCLITVFAFVGCGDKELESAVVTRDDARVGGSLSFVYNKDTKTIYVGGEDEIVQYSFEDLGKGIAEGNRVGLKITAPDENLDVGSATLEMNGINYASGSFLESVNGQKQRFFNIYPAFSSEDKEMKFSVVWQEGTKAQDYKVKIVAGTKFMDKEGNIN